MRPCSAAERLGPEVAVASMGIRQHTDATRGRPIDEGIAMSGTGFAYPNLFGKKVPPPAPRWAGNARYNFIGGHNDPQPDPDRGADRRQPHRCCAAKARSWRCTTWRRGRRAIAVCASSSPTSSAAGAASRPTRRRRADHLGLGPGHRSDQPGAARTRRYGDPRGIHLWRRI